jgi:Na+-driven multidrug efflux pump
VLGASFSVIMLSFGRPIYRALGGQGGELDAAVAYSNVVFAGNVLLWLMNGLANVVRGTGNMLVPALITCVGVVVLVPLSPLLIFGIGPFPALGIGGGGVALVLYYAAGTAVLGWYVLSGRNIARLRMSRLRWPLFRSILGVGAVASVTSLQTNVIIALVTALVATTAGPGAAAGYGTGARLEYLLIPIVFGLGAPLVALVGTNIGAGHRERALRIAFVGAAIAVAITEAIGTAQPSGHGSGSRSSASIRAWSKREQPICAWSDRRMGSSAWASPSTSHRRERDGCSGRYPPGSCACWSQSALDGSRFT